MQIKTLAEQTGVEEKCVLCGTRENLTIDHLIPKSRVKKGERNMYIILCQACNHMKGSMLIEELAEHLGLIYQRVREMAYYKWLFSGDSKEVDKSAASKAYPEGH